ncbi:sensor histidine kinase [Castellaniella sp. FW104-16D08]|uniref:sensor histidine kinase n=1 Tax=unclassified Castellaniella TaxID=2617606 RepID=UPI0033158EE4
MRPRLHARYQSLRVRLLAALLAWVLLSVLAAGWGIQQLFRQHIMAQLQSELNIYLDQLTAVLQVNAGGQIALSSLPGDPRFNQPYSGLYWQVSVSQADGKITPVLRSRSLWDADLPQQYSGLQMGRDLATEAVGPSGQQLRVRARLLQPADGPYDELLLIAGADQHLWAEPIDRFNRMLALALGILVLGMAIAAWAQVSYGLSPLVRLRRRLLDVREGRASHIEGVFPTEVQPLVQDFNEVLDRNQQALDGARREAGNLAHALKTPLAVLANAARAKDPALPELVSEQVQVAHRQVDYHLAQARAAAAIRVRGLSSPVAPLLQGLVRVMQRVHADRALQYDLSGVDESLAFRGESQDFEEMLGNVLDNAGKWARRRVQVSARKHENMLEIKVEDDGPGLRADRTEAVFERGQRADERRPGSGLGLSIVRDLAQLYGGRAYMETGTLGGACVVICLPAVG